MPRPVHAQHWLRLSAAQRGAWYGFLLTHAATTRALDTELELEHGLPLSSFDVLLQLAVRGRMRMAELAEAALISRSGLTRLVDRLERQGLVERARGEHDPRAVYASLTATGLAKLDEAAPTHIQGIRRVFLDRLTKAQTQQLAEIWDALTAQAPQAAPLR